MKKTKIKIRGYCCDFEIEVLKKEHLNIEQAELYVKKEIIDTAFIIEVTQLNQEGNLTLFNDAYRNPSEIKINIDK